MSQGKRPQIKLRPELIVPVLVAVIGLLGVTTAAFIANIDKWFPKPADQTEKVSNVNNSSESGENQGLEREYQLSGLVKDENGSISGAELIAGTERTYSAADGHFTIKVKGVVYSVFRLKASKNGYENWSEDVQILPNDLLIIKLEPQ
jgi:hypothetical protein